ncbi:hypothetical protein B7463_g5437, partial [Scytalidium lignicola]
MYSLVAFLAIGGVSAVSIPRSTCSFQLTASGGQSGTVGQLPDGQNRIGGGYPQATYTIGSGVITDSTGRGCILTPSIEQWQCDTGATPASGFSIGGNGRFNHSGSTVFYACPASDTEWNIYTTPVAGQLKCVEISLTASGCGSGAPSAPSITKTSKVWSNSTVVPPPASSVEYTTSTIYTTSVSTIISCAPTVTNCPARSTVLTTVTIPVSTTVCPVASATTSPAASIQTTPASPSVPVISTPKSTKVPETPTITETAPVAPTTTPAQQTTPGSPPSPPSPPASEGPSTVTVTVYQQQCTCGPETQIPPPVATVPGVSSTTAIVPPPTAPTSTPAVSSTPLAPTTTPETSKTIETTKPAVPTTSVVPTTPAVPTTKTYYTNTTSSVHATTYSSSSQVSTTKSSIATSTQPASTCTPTVLTGSSTSGNYQYPHLIVPISSSTPNTAAGTSYFGTISSNTSTIFNFDIPPTYSGHTCSLIFLLPEKSQLETSSYTFSGSGSIDVSQLSSVAAQGTTWSNAPSVASDLGDFTITPGSSTLVKSFACPAGTAVSYELSAVGDTYLNYFQDWNPSPIGLYITTC